MLAFNVYRNNERVCIAGVGDRGVLHAAVTWVAHDPQKIPVGLNDTVPDQRLTEITLDVGGLRSTDRMHLRWAETDLQVGDEIRIQIVEAERADPVIREYRDDPAKNLDAKKNYVREVAKELGWVIREA
jgi:hypothetical protein